MDMRRTLPVALITLVAVLVTPRAARTDEKDVSRGEALAKVLCANCHLNVGQGEKSGPHGVPAFSAIANRPQQSMHGVVRWLESRPVMMPEHRLTRDETYLLAQYIMSLRSKP